MHNFFAALTRENGRSYEFLYLTGLRGSCKNAGLRNDMMVSVDAGFEEDDGYKAVQRLLARYEKLQVIIAVNDPVAIGAYRFLKENRIKVPKDIALAGFSDLKSSDILQVPLTTVRENTLRIGQMAIEILLEKIDNPDYKIRKQQLEPEFVARQSA